MSRMPVSLLRYLLFLIIALRSSTSGIRVNDSVDRVCRKLKFESLVLEGGGLKGLAYVGAMESLAENGYFSNNVWQFKNISGTSIGCLFGYFTALDISPKNLRSIALKTNFTNLFHENVKSILGVPQKPMSDSVFQKIRYFYNLLDYMRKVFNVWYQNDAPGVSNGNEIIKWIMLNAIKYSPYKNIITASTTFREFEDITQHSLTCYTTKISSGGSSSSSSNGSSSLMELNAHTAPNQKIINVLYSSMTLPMIFKPLNDKFGNTLVDGGLILNFPIYQQDWNGRKNSRVLGLSLHEQPPGAAILETESKSFDFFSHNNDYSTISTFSYLQRLVSVVTSLKSYLLYSNDPRNCDRVVYLNATDIPMLDIYLSRDKILRSIEVAYAQTDVFLKPSKTHICEYNTDVRRMIR